jgi:hypothetical protein
VSGLQADEQYRGPPSRIQVECRTRRRMGIQLMHQLELRELVELQADPAGNGQVGRVAAEEHLVRLVRLLVRRVDGVGWDRDDRDGVGLVADDDPLAVGAPGDVEGALGDGYAGNGFALCSRTLPSFMCGEARAYAGYPRS